MKQEESENSLLIGAIIHTKQDKEGIIIDKGVRSTTYGSSPTGFLCMNNKGFTFPIVYDDIRQIISFGGNPVQYMTPKTEI